MKQMLDIPRTAMEVFNLLPEGTRCEVIDNTLYMSPSPTTDHQDLLGDIFFVLKQAVTQSKLGRVYVSPLDVYLDNGLSVVQSDIIFITTNHSDRVQKKGIIGSPDLVIEILSSNKGYDRNLKFNLYQSNLISEYIIIDPETKEVWQYQLNNAMYQKINSNIGELNIKFLNLLFNF